MFRRELGVEGVPKLKKYKITHCLYLYMHNAAKPVKMGKNAWQRGAKLGEPSHFRGRLAPKLGL